MNKTILITGVAGFIGHALTKTLLSKGWRVVGIDNLSAVIDEIRAIKQYRLSKFISHENFTFIKEDIKALSDATVESLHRYGFSQMVHLAANAGIREAARRSVEYIENNIIGFYKMIELAHQLNLHRFVYASSSSIYGNYSGDRMREFFYEPKNIYAVTKIADELIAKVYSENYKFNTVGLRFFSVYGPCGRPDMAPWIFTKSIMRDEIISVSNGGEVWRDFTYIDDLVLAIDQILESEPTDAGWHVCDIGANDPHSLNDMIALIERYYGTTARRVNQMLTKEEADHTQADFTTYSDHYPMMTFTPFDEGVTRLCRWMEEYMEK